MLSKVSIKDHPHCKQIVDLAKEIHAGEPKHLCQGKNAHDYLMQAKVMFELSQSAHAPLCHHPGPLRNLASWAALMLKSHSPKLLKRANKGAPLCSPPSLAPPTFQLRPSLKTTGKLCNEKRPHVKAPNLPWFLGWCWSHTKFHKHSCCRPMRKCLLVISGEF